MTYRISPKAGFVTMTSVAALMALGLSGTSAQAACVKVGTLVTCNAASPAYIDGGAGITVEVKALATVTAGAGSAVGLTGGGGQSPIVVLSMVPLGLMVFCLIKVD